jgi:uncharacterized membrane protein YbhN (UPF0104 family)
MNPQRPGVIPTLLRTQRSTGVSWDPCLLPAALATRTHESMSAETLATPEIPTPDASPVRRRFMTALVLAVALLTLLLALPPLKGVWRQVEHMKPGWLAVSAALELGSCLGFVVIFRFYFPEVEPNAARRLAWAEQGSGALLPTGGVGAVAIGAWLLRRFGLPGPAVVKRSSALFFLTSAVNVLVLMAAGAVLVVGGVGPDPLLYGGLPLVLGGAVLAGALLAPRVARARLSHSGWMSQIVEGIDMARRHLVRPHWRLLGALAYLLCDIGVLAATLAATGHHIPVAGLTVAYIVGYLANGLPIPGSFGVLEAGLAGALIAYGAPPTQAAAAVVVYHAIAFWIPSLGGILGYTGLRRQLLSEVAKPAPACAAQRSKGHLGLAPARMRGACQPKRKIWQIKRRRPVPLVTMPPGCEPDS